MVEYVCNCDKLTVQGPDGQPRVVRFGDPIPEASLWRYAALRAHLDWGKIREVNGGTGASLGASKPAVSVHVSSAARPSSDSNPGAGATATDDQRAAQAKVANATKKVKR